MADNPVVQRGPGGLFLPGNSGNPSGRPKGVGEIRELAKQYVPEAISRIAQLVHSEDERVAFVAAQEILNRAFGRPGQSVEGDSSRDAAAGIRQLYLQVVKQINAPAAACPGSENTPPAEPTASDRAQSNEDDAW